MANGASPTRSDTHTPNPALAEADQRFYVRFAKLLLSTTIAVTLAAIAFGRWGGAVGALLLGGAAAAVVRAHASFYAFQYLYFCRQPILLYLLTLALPWLAAYPLQSFGQNLLVFTPAPAAWAGLVLGAVAFAQASSLRLILRASGTRCRLPLRRGDDDLLAQQHFDFHRWWIVIGALPVVAWGWLLVRFAPTARIIVVGGAFVLLFVVGFGGSWALLVATGKLLAGTAEGGWAGRWRTRIFRLADRVFRWFGAGYLDHAASHLGLALSMVIAATLYWVGWWGLAPPDPVIRSFPAVAYVLVLVLVFSWSLPALSFVLDKYRIPVFVVLLPLWWVLQLISEPDHHYAFLPGVKGGPPPVAETLVAERIAASVAPNSRPLVVVAASGGGITASLWTASVLAALQTDDELGPDFARDIGLVSTASGGSVGAMFYVGGYTPAGPPADPWEAAEIAGTSSLEATAWGLVYPDFIRAITGFFPLDDRKSRAWANEQIWARHTKDATLGGWAEGVTRGWRPLQLFNVTEVETGAAVQLAAARMNVAAGAEAGREAAVDPLCCDPAQPSCRPRSAAYGLTWAPGSNDLAVATAARLSATFPYVFPVSRGKTPDGQPCGNHLADGGYFDNFGVHAAVQVMDGALSRLATPAQPGARPHLIIVQIEAFPESVATRPIAGWEGVTLGPLITLLGVRSASQADRNRTELELFEKRWREVAQIERVRFVLDPKAWPPAAGGADGKACELRDLRLQCERLATTNEPLRARDLPTSWQLSCEEKRAVICHLAHGIDVRRELVRLRDVYKTARGR